MKQQTELICLGAFKIINDLTLKHYILKQYNDIYLNENAYPGLSPREINKWITQQRGWMHQVNTWQVTGSNTVLFRDNP